MKTKDLKELGLIDDQIDAIMKTNGQDMNNARNGLKRILMDLIDNKDYKTDFEIKSRFKNYDYFNIGKTFWSSTIEHDADKTFSKLKEKSIAEVIDYINDNKNYDFDLDEALEKYFDETKIQELLDNPELFCKINDFKYHFSILKKLYFDDSTIDVDGQQIVEFLKVVISRCSNEENTWLWIEILRKNSLINKLEIIGILQKIFDILIVKENVYEIDSNYIFYAINNTIFHCFSYLCGLHIISNDIMKYIENTFSKYSTNQNRYILLSSLASKYDEIYDSDSKIKSFLLDMIKGNDNDCRSIFNGLILSTGKNKFELIKNEYFRKSFLQLDNEAIDYYSQAIFLNYMDFDEDYVYFVAKNSKMDFSSQIIRNYLKNNYGDLNVLVNILDFYSQNPNVEINISKEMLDLLNTCFTCDGLRRVIEDIANLKYSYLEWKELEPYFVEILYKDESFFIQKMFIPLSSKYLDENKYYVEEEYCELFDKIYLLLKDDNNIDAMKNVASKAFDLGLEKFKKYN